MGFFDFLNSKPKTPDYSEVIAALNQAGQTSASMGTFQPVTVTTSFGTPTYQYDDQGRLISAGYTASPYLQGLQTGSQGLTTAYLNAAQQALGMTQPLQYAEQIGAGGGQLFNLAQQALPTSYDVAGKTQEYYNRMQQLVAPEREKQLASTRQSLFNTGRQGLAIGATQEGGQLATNPEMAAYYNAIAQQDLGLANQAEQRARENLLQDISTATGLYKSGTGMFQTVPDMQNAYYQNLAASQVPYTSSLNTLNTLESMAQQPLQLGFQFGAPVTQGMQYGGNMLWNAAQAGAGLQTNQINAETAAANTPTFLQSLTMGTIGSLAKAGTNYLTSGADSGGGLFSNAYNWASSSSNPFSNAGQAMSNSGFSWSPSGWSMSEAEAKNQGWI